MASNITVLNSYLKGTKTIKGSFPIYVNSTISTEGVNICSKGDVQYQKTEDIINILLKEDGSVGLSTQESDDINTVLFYVQPDNFELYYIEI
jgi:hypothetical protein